MAFAIILSARGAVLEQVALVDAAVDQWFGDSESDDTRI